MNETNLVGEIDEVFPTLARAAVTARHKGEYVPDLAKWDYELPNYFIDTGATMVAVHVAEALQQANPIDVRLRVNLSKIYRNVREPERAVALFRDYSGDFTTRAMWTEWGVAEQSAKQDPFAAVVLCAAALSDLPRTYPPTKSDGRAMAALAFGLLNLHELYGNEEYRLAALACAEIGKIYSTEETTIGKLAEARVQALKVKGDLSPTDDHIELISRAVRSVTEFIDVHKLTLGRLSQAELTNFTGLRGLFQRVSDSGQ